MTLALSKGTATDRKRLFLQFRMLQDLLAQSWHAGPNDLMGSSLEAWENCIWHAKNLRSNVEDLGAAMFPPQVLRSTHPLTRPNLPVCA